MGYNLRWLMRAGVRLSFKSLLPCLLWLAYWARLALMTPTLTTPGTQIGPGAQGFALVLLEGIFEK